MIYIAHHGIRGQKWGQRNGPPYPLSGGDYSAEEEKHLRERSSKDNSRYNKKHYDKTIEQGTTLTTLSRDKDRLNDTDMYFAAYKNLDKHQYNALFNQKAPETIFDDKGNEVGTGMYLKYRINSTALKNIRVASEDSGAKAFAELYRDNRDFYNYVTDPDRMSKAFDDSRYKFKSYRDAKKTLDSIELKEKPSYEDIKTIYRLYNYSLPYSSTEDTKLASDVKNQRAKFFKKLKEQGYGAVLDTNDALYGAYNATAPVIVFDMDSVAVSNIERSTMTSKEVSKLIFVGRKALGL